LKTSSQTSSTIEPETPLDKIHFLPGDPDCPVCHGLGYLRKDLPIGHSEFGKVHICSCRHQQISVKVRQRLFQLSQLDELSHLNFENFQQRGRIGLWPQQADSLEQAYNHAQRFAQSLDGWLLLQGDNGCGKTHLAAAIANFAVSIGVPTLFITVPDMLDTIRFAYSDPESTFEDRFDEIRKAPLLILDDFGTQNATSWAKEKLFQILNYRYINHLPLVVTTNLAEKDIEDRIDSRLQDPELVTRVRIIAPDYRNPMRDFGHHELSSLELLTNKTFTNFHLRRDENIPKEHLQSLEKAFNAARLFAEKPKGWLVILGEFGSGKTHLAAAIANYISDVDAPPILKSVPELLLDLRATFSPDSTTSLSRRFEEVRNANILLLVKLGTQATTPWVKDILYQLLDHRYYAELPTVITTEMKLENMDPHLRSRMQDTRICHIYITGVPPYTGGSMNETKSRTKQGK